jgi:hypothetical protein
MARFFCSLVFSAAAIALAGCSPHTNTPSAANNPNVPGATGRTVVPGSSSTVSGDAEATELQQKWGVGRER